MKSAPKRDAPGMTRCSVINTQPLKTGFVRLFDYDSGSKRS